MKKQTPSYTVEYINLLKNKILDSITHIILTTMDGVQYNIAEFSLKKDGRLEYYVNGNIKNFNNIKIYAGEVLLEDYNTIWVSPDESIDATIRHEINIFEWIQ